MRNLRELAAHLREVLPTIHLVKFRRRKATELSADAYGVCSFVQPEGRDPYFSITIDASIPWRMAQLIAIHEYAHALSWTVEHPNHEDHGPEFGIAYAKTYQHVMETP